LGPANLDSLKADNRDRYFQFVGALQDALFDYQTENKKQPDEKALNVIASRLLQEQITHKGIFWDTKTTTFEVPVQEETPEYNQIKNTLMRATGVEPTPQQIQRNYTRLLLKRLYSPKPEAQQGSAVTPPESK
jgi:hypothetical protein